LLTIKFGGYLYLYQKATSGTSRSVREKIEFWRFAEGCRNDRFLVFRNRLANKCISFYYYKNNSSLVTLTIKIFFSGSTCRINF
jgi:hypothetical protein